MTWVSFSQDHDFRGPGFTIAYKSGTTENVTRACAAEALAKGKGVVVEKKARGDGDKT